MSTAERDLLESDVIFLEAMERADEAFLRALRGYPVEGYRPRSIYTPLNIPPSQAEASVRRRQEAASLAALKAERDRVERLRVTRDPCPLCAVRGDIGCKHRRAA